MRILPVIARLKAQCALLENRVEVAKSLTALSDDEVSSGLPIAFVFPVKEAGNESNTVGLTSQRVPKTFCVRIAAKPTNGVDEPLEDVRDQIKDALIGWEQGADGPVEFADGEIFDTSTSVIWWQDIYRTFTFNRG